MPADDGPVAEEKVAARSSQVSSVLVIEGNKVPGSEVPAGATPPDVRSVQVASDAESQRLMGGRDACK